jgi:glycosyltransferase involved in cell wall biosynthesis
MLIADSTITRNDLIGNLGVPAEKIEVVNLGVGAEFKPRKRDDLGEVKKIGYLGAISKKKNVKELIDAFYLLKKKHPDLKVSLDLWGRIGKHGPELTRHIELLGLKNVCFRGFAAEYSLPSVYNSLDVFVFPSLKEGFGLPILEAKRCGVPTIMFEGAHIADEVKAHSVLASNVSDMADRIYNILADSEYADSIRRKALEHSSQFTWDRTINGVLQVYNNLGYSCPVGGR